MSETGVTKMTGGIAKMAPLYVDVTWLSLVCAYKYFGGWLSSSLAVSVGLDQFNSRRGQVIRWNKLDIRHEIVTVFRLLET